MMDIGFDRHMLIEECFPCLRAEEVQAKEHYNIASVYGKFKGFLDDIECEVEWRIRDDDITHWALRLPC